MSACERQGLLGGWPFARPQRAGPAADGEERSQEVSEASRKEETGTRESEEGPWHHASRTRYLSYEMWRVHAWLCLARVA
jgi:hypothetical protein